MRRVQAETGRIFSVDFTERFEVRATTRAGELVGVFDLAEERRLAQRQVTVTFDPAPPADLERALSLLMPNDLPGDALCVFIGKRTGQSSE